eukprot:72599-Lingulodinium_polyedra.AAC.1
MNAGLSDWLGGTRGANPVDCTRLALRPRNLARSIATWGPYSNLECDARDSPPAQRIYPNN